MTPPIAILGCIIILLMIMLNNTLARIKELTRENSELKKKNNRLIMEEANGTGQNEED